MACMFFFVLFLCPSTLHTPPLWLCFWVQCYTDSSSNLSVSLPCRLSYFITWYAASV